MKPVTITGYAVSRGKIVRREVFTLRKDAAKAIDLKTAKGTRGFAVRWGRVVETLTTPSGKKSGRTGRLRHQQIGGDGDAWEDWIEPFPSRAEAKKNQVKQLRRIVAGRASSLLQAEHDLAKALAK